MSTEDRTRRAWAYLSRVADAPSTALHAFIGLHGPVGAEALIRSRSELPERVRTATQARHHLDLGATDLALVASLGGRLVTTDDAEWPGWALRGFGRETAVQRLVEGRDAVAPVALWVRGAARLDELVDRAVAVVGTRDVSAYGERVTAQLCADLVVDGVTIVSGGAYGVDGAAHRAALGAAGRTLAVLACGVDRAYPAGHAALLSRIVADGLVVSEHPPGTTAARYRFLARNRLVAALGAGAVVVEAGWRSGARSTATWARSLGLPAMAVPGPVTSLQSTGCHRMIREREAHLVTSAAEVLELVGRVGELALEPVVARRPLDGRDPVQARVYEAMPTRGALPLSVVAVRSGVGTPSVRSALVALELDGLVVRTDEGWVRTRPARSGA